MKGYDALGAERAIGKKYAIMMRDVFKRQVSVLDKKSGKLNRAGYRVRVRNLMVQSIAVQTVYYAFINYHGVFHDRRQHSFKSKAGNMFTRKAHPFKLNPKIQTLEIPENIINGFADELAEVRGNYVLAEASKNLKLSSDQ